MYTCHCQNEKCVLCEARLSSRLSSLQVCEIRGLLSRRRYSAGEALFREGAPCTTLMVLRAGQLKLTITPFVGHEQILGLLEAGQLTGFETSDATYPYTATALTPVEVCCITHKEMLRVLEENPTVALSVIQLFHDELTQAQAMIRNLGIKAAHARVASFILSLFPVGTDPAESLPLVLSRLEIAELLGLSEETVSRMFAEFKRKGLIEAPRGEIRLLDIGQLKRLSGE